MKCLKKTTLTVFTLAILSTALAFGQTEIPPEIPDDGQARDLFKTYVRAGTQGSPGARIRLELLRMGKREFVPMTTVFRAGDKVKLHFEVNFPAYVEIYNQASSGQFQKLFPFTDASVQVKARTGYTVPGNAQEWFEFDDHAGAERLSFIFSGVQIRPANSVAKPAPKSAPKPVKRYEPGIVVNSATEEKQLAIDELNQRALDEGRDLKRVKVENEQYVFSQPQRLRQALGVMVMLNHR